MAYEEITARLRTEVDSLRDPSSGCLHAETDPGRLNALDSLFLAWQRLEREPESARLALLTLKDFQGQVHDPVNGEAPGMIPSSCRPQLTPWSPWLTSDFQVLETTPLFILIACRLLADSKDRTLRDLLWPLISRACGWINENIRTGDSGLLFRAGDKPGTLVLNHRKKIRPATVAAVEIQGYAYAALRRAAALAERFSEADAADTWNGLAAGLQKKLSSDFWIRKDRYFALAMKGRNMDAAVTSFPGQLLFTGILNKVQTEQIIRRLFRADLFTPYGIRTRSSADRSFGASLPQQGAVRPLDNWIISEGLRLAGRRREQTLIKTGLLRAYRELGRLPEYYAVSPAGQLSEIPEVPCPHACASAALLGLLED
ncbi:MAG: amylo-alpha-1,6-glucosidase [Patescibacteria group bacterium]|jgi:glycogen debranching enzyme